MCRNRKWERGEERRDETCEKGEEMEERRGEERDQSGPLSALCHPELKVRTPAHTKQPGWYVEFESRVTPTKRDVVSARKRRRKGKTATCRP